MSSDEQYFVISCSRKNSKFRHYITEDNSFGPFSGDGVPVPVSQRYRNTKDIKHIDQMRFFPSPRAAEKFLAEHLQLPIYRADNPFENFLVEPASPSFLAMMAERKFQEANRRLVIDEVMNGFDFIAVQRAMKLMRRGYTGFKEPPPIEELKLRARTALNSVAGKEDDGNFQHGGFRAYRSNGQLNLSYEVGHSCANEKLGRTFVSNNDSSIREQSTGHKPSSRSIT